MDAKDLLATFLPDGLLEYFEITALEQSSDSYTIHLEEQNIHPTEYSTHKLTSKGFYDSVTIQDFPIRGKACYLCVKRRKWLNETTGENVFRDWKLVAKGTRMTSDFAAFLKALLRHSSSEL